MPDPVGTVPPRPSSTPPSSSSKPSWVPQADWDFILSVTRGNVIGAQLIAAIGLHETQWGSVGVGRDYIFGYGVPATGAKMTQYSGFQTQVRAVWSKIERFWGAGGPQSAVQPGEILNFMQQSWKPGDQNWWRGVWGAYTKQSGAPVTLGTAQESTSSTGFNIDTPLGKLTIPAPVVNAKIGGVLIALGVIWLGGMIVISSFSRSQ